MTNATNNLLPTVGILMINYNQWELTHNCINSVLNSEKVNVLIGLIDNNSNAETPDWVNKTKQVIFYKSSKNSGFIAGNIKAFEILQDQKEKIDFVILLNNDTEVAPDMLKLLVEQFERHPETGLATPAITYAENPQIIWHAGGTFIPTKMAVKQKYKLIDELPQNPEKVDQVSGCAMMMRPELFKKIGYQDPDLFIYHEDVEQSIKSLKLGNKNFLVPKARMQHHVSITVGGALSPFAVYFAHRNRYIFASRNLHGVTLAKFRIYYLFTTLAKTINYPLKKQSNLVYWMWLAFKHGLQNSPQMKPKGLFKVRSKE